MNIEDLKEEIRKNSEERIRGVESAQARIDALIARAGGPMVICKNVQESDAVKRESRMQMLYDVADYRYDGDLLAYPVVLADMIDRMEAALANVLGQRDQLLCDLKEIADIHSTCLFCLNRTKAGDEKKCDKCSRINSKWVWRGVPDKEE